MIVISARTRDERAVGQEKFCHVLFDRGSQLQQIHIIIRSREINERSAFSSIVIVVVVVVVKCFHSNAVRSYESTFCFQARQNSNEANIAPA